MQERKEPSLDTGTTAPAPPPVPERTPRQRRRWLRRLMMGIAVCLIALCMLLGLAWWWAGQADSLSRTLARVASWMPADQKLEADGIEGSLRAGGRVEWLRWTSPAMQIEIKGADIAWRLQPLLSRELRFGRINMDELRIRSTPQAKDDTPTQPLQSLHLPMSLDVPVRIERVIWEGPPETLVTELYGHYRYNGNEHALEVSSLRYAEGLYEANVNLQATAPMKLKAELKGAVKTPLPNQPGQFLQVLADAQIEGTLATEAAQLDIKATARTAPEEGTDTAPDHALSADIEATVRPWLAQPLEQASAQLRHVDMALFMPGGPRTDLNGSLQAGPQGTGWKLDTQLANTLPGPWDQLRLPVRTLTANVTFDGEQTWQLSQARIDLGPSGPAHIQAQASFDAAAKTLQGQAQLLAVNPAQLYSTLDAAPLNGTLAAQTDVEQSVQFELDVQAAPATSAQALRIELARAEGTWKAPLLHVRNLHVNALQAQLKSPELTVDTQLLRVQGKLQAQVPGTELQADLNASPDDGQGRVNMQLRSAEQLSQWLNRLPLLKNPLGDARLQGSAQAQMDWRGGWGKLQQRLQNPSAPRQASGLQLKGQITAPQLSYITPFSDTSEVKDLNIQFNGSPESLQASLTTQAQLGVQTLSVDTRMQGGLLAAQNAAATDWQARIESLRATWSAQGNSATAWQVQLTEALTASQRTTGNPVRSTSVQLTEGSLSITPPRSAGEQKASISWTPTLLRQTGNGQWQVQSKGTLQGVPLIWVDAFSPDPSKTLLNQAGVGGDLVLQGHWDVDNTGRQLRADVVLERASGDIRLAVEDADAAPVTIVRSSGSSQAAADTLRPSNASVVQLGRRGMRARLQDLRVQMGAQGNELRLQLLWNSERAGQINADLRSQMRQNAQGFDWPENAPLSGTLKAAMPNIGVWALFAPPGWRVGGTLNADVAISGTRSAPLWNGQLSADQLSVLSLLDGVDMKDGRLRAQLKGTRLDITELFLRGGEGSSARILGQSGNLTAAPRDGGTLTGTGYVEYSNNAADGSSGIRMDIRAQAQALQVLVRADRQLSVSGGLQAGMNDGQVTLRGDLKVDRAAILLADESAPKLDSDVHVHTAASRKAAAQAAAQKAQQAQAPAQPAGSVEAVKPPDLQVALDLGNDFALQGYGITTRLEGQLLITNGPRITGEIHTVNGRYRAWGQSLDVESGTVRFSGPYANPAIDITAIRPNIAVRAGVKVTGSANNPRVALFSEPDMSDAEKLSWVVMGRDTSAGGAETALLQQAALALLSGGGTGENFAGRFGLDEVGLKGPSEDGESGAAITVGKRLSKDFYVSYEQSLTGAMGTLYIFYDLSRRLTLRGQTGEQTAVDLIYTKTKD
ncbi:MAG: translocation/assembly module TamB domain-containing protein [Comamonas sp.]|nr:translocation/assembly module TamB domain-containing protein [Comamonas sp.]